MSGISSIPSSLQGHIPSQISRWRMRAMDKNRPLILVEGDTDKRLFDCIFKHPTKVDFPKGSVKNNKKSVIAAIYALAQTNAVAVAGIVDADYDRITGQLLNLPNLFYTDEHDMEMQIIMSGSFRRYLNNSKNHRKFSTYWSSRGASTDDWIEKSRELIVDLAIEIGLYRMAAFDLDPNTRFPLVDQSICNLKLQVDSSQIMNKLVANGLNRARLVSRFSHFSTTILHNLRHQVARGHDATCILAIAMKDAFAAKTRITADDIEIHLRTGYGVNDLSTSILYSKLATWATNNRISLSFWQ